MMSLHEFERALQAQVAESVRLESDRDGRMYIAIPLTFGDGDEPVIAPRKDGSGWALSDEGSTMMRLSWKLSEKERKDPERLRNIDGAMKLGSVVESKGELIRRVEGENYAEALFDFVQALLRIDDLGYPDPPPARKKVVSGKVHGS